MSGIHLLSIIGPRHNLIDQLSIFNIQSTLNQHRIKTRFKSKIIFKKYSPIIIIISKLNTLFIYCNITILFLPYAYKYASHLISKSSFCIFPYTYKYASHFISKSSFCIFLYYAPSFTINCKKDDLTVGVDLTVTCFVGSELKESKECGGQKCTSTKHYSKNY